MQDILLVLSIVIGFWLGWKALPFIIIWLEEVLEHPLPIFQARKTLLRLILGGLFSFTVLKIAGILVPLVLLLVNPAWCAAQPVPTPLGVLDICLYQLPSLVIFLVVFGLVYFFWFEKPEREFNKAENFFWVFFQLTAAAILFTPLQMIFTNFFWG